MSPHEKHWYNVFNVLPHTHALPDILCNWCPPSERIISENYPHVDMLTKAGCMCGSHIHVMVVSFIFICYSLLENIHDYHVNSL